MAYLREGTGEMWKRLSRLLMDGRGQAIRAVAEVGLLTEIAAGYKAKREGMKPDQLHPLFASRDVALRWRV
jgi:hypothetical protein